MNMKRLEITNMWIKQKICTLHTVILITFFLVFGIHFVVTYKHPYVSTPYVNVKKVNTLTTTLMSFKQQKDMGLIFPSWLVHYVPPSES